MKKMIPMLFVITLLFDVTAGLQTYNVDSSKVSVSGISSGGGMAVQLHFALSSRIMGVGVIAGVPYKCAKGSVLTSTMCMLKPYLINISELKRLTDSAAWAGKIDATSNLGNSRVYIFAGSLDTIVKPEAGRRTEYLYKLYTNNNNIKTVYNINAQHCMPTSNYGGLCRILNVLTYLNDCDYSAAFELLNHIYGGSLIKPNSRTQASGQLLAFRQGDFFYYSLPSYFSMDLTGYVYIPSGCADKTETCKLHIALHGCQQGRHRLGTVYVQYSGYNEVAELNNIIILYPQAISTLANTQGCWDWFGYTGSQYAHKTGYQITAIRRMIDHIVG